MAEELDPEKYHVLTPKQTRPLVLIVAFVLLLVLPPISYFYYDFAIHRQNQSAKETTFEIHGGQSLYDVANALYNADLVNSKPLFLLYSFLSGSDENIQAGTYEVPAGTSVVGLVELFQHGTNDVKITFLEGWRLEEFALAASEKFENIDYENFVEIAKESEGYLFPDTYLFSGDINELEMIEALKTTFDEKTKDILTEEKLSAAGLTRHEAIILASIVEREVSDPEDRAIVAGILIKRWRLGLKLDADATTQYVASTLRVECDLSESSICPTDDVAGNMIWWPRELTASELSYDSPYNTRENVGLPPRPISSVSAATLEAVLNYKETGYNYYLTDGDGVTHYAETLEEHEANVYRYLN